VAWYKYFLKRVMHISSLGLFRVYLLDTCNAYIHSEELWTKEYNDKDLAEGVESNVSGMGFN